MLDLSLMSPLIEFRMTRRHKLISDSGDAVLEKKMQILAFDLDGKGKK